MRACSTALLAVSLVAAGPRAWAQAPEPLLLTVDEAIARGLDASHRLEEVAARGDVASALVDQRHAATLPKLDGLAGYTRTNHVDAFGLPLPNGRFVLVYPDIPENYRTRLDAQWPLYTGGRLPALERVARAEATASASDLAAARSDLKVEIARAYWNLVAAIDGVRVLDESLAQVDAHLRDARNRLNAGLIPPNEVLTVEAQQSRQRMLRIEAIGFRDVAEAALGRLVGLPPVTPIRPNVGPGVPPPVNEPFAELLAAARSNRPERRALADRVTAAQERGAAAAAGARPTVAVGGGYDYAMPNPRIFPRQPNWRQSWDASINVDWPIFDGGRTSAEKAEAVANERAAEARLAEFDTLLGLEVRQRLTEIETSRAAIAAADDTIRAATEARRVVSERFAAGVATSTDVLDAQTDIVRAELDRTRAIAALRTAEAGLARAIGR